MKEAIMNDLQEIILTEVMTMMQWPREKAELWYWTANPLLGDCSPASLVEMDRGHKVIKFIEYAKDENGS